MMEGQLGRARAPRASSGRLGVNPLSRRLASVGLWFGVALLAGCGGGGDEAPPPQAPPCDADTRVCYVSPTGRDTNSGATTGDPFGSIAHAAQVALSDYSIVVQPGSYRGEVTTAETGQTPKRLRFLAVGHVLVDVRGINGAAGFSFSNSDGTLIDGFEIIGAADAGIAVKSSNGDGSDNVVIRNCIIHGNPGDGIRIQDSDEVSIFNNLIYQNTGIGVRIGGGVSGSNNAEIINNTIYGNGSRGIEIGTSRAASPSALVLNNIVQFNNQDSAAGDNIKVETSPPSYVGYVGDNNIVFPGVYVPSGLIGIRGPNDINEDAQFLNPAGEDYRVSPTSAAINTGNSLTERIDLRQILLQRSVTGFGTDSGRIDIGYHFRPN
jgi:parallel beta-helix repeat protein